MAHLEGTLSATGLRVAIAVARFNQFITERLLQGAEHAYGRCGGDTASLDVVWVPGAFELPLTTRALADSGRYDAIVALGAVIRGSTAHFDYVCSAATTGLAAVTRESRLPVAFGVLTCDTVDQAIDRAGAKAGNKGEEAMVTAIEMANLLKQLGTAPS